MEHCLKSSRRSHGVTHNGEMEKRKQQMVNSTKKVKSCETLPQRFFFISRVKS